MMASKSGGTIPTVNSIADANQAIALLDAMHFWGAKKLNTGHGRQAYEVSITHGERRVKAIRRFFIDAVIAALAKLRKADVGFMRIAK